MHHLIRERKNYSVEYSRDNSSHHYNHNSNSNNNHNHNHNNNKNNVNGSVNDTKNNIHVGGEGVLNIKKGSNIPYYRMAMTTSLLDRSK